MATKCADADDDLLPQLPNLRFAMVNPCVLFFDSLSHPVHLHEATTVAHVIRQCGPCGWLLFSHTRSQMHRV